ncbi:hypothetical protein [Legionella sp.]|uniref:hypothetical protein n=1 Tax=Legionella sp. TaxID=459 RepID=UPI003CA36636
MISFGDKSQSYDHIENRAGKQPMKLQSSLIVPYFFMLSRIANNPMAWMISINDGFIFDAGHAPYDI